MGSELVSRCSGSPSVLPDPPHPVSTIRRPSTSTPTSTTPSLFVAYAAGTLSLLSSVSESLKFNTFPALGHGHFRLSSL